MSAAIPETIQERRRFLKLKLAHCVNRKYYCRALDCYILVTDKSIEETAYQASISRNATKLALRLPDVIKEAAILDLHLPPKPGRQTKRMKFVRLGNLLASIPRVGKAKLTIGYLINGDCIEYAITEYLAGN